MKTLIALLFVVPICLQAQWVCIDKSNQYVDTTSFKYSVHKASKVIFVGFKSLITETHDSLTNLSNEKVNSLKLKDIQSKTVISYAVFDYKHEMQKPSKSLIQLIEQKVPKELLQTKP